MITCVACRKIKFFFWADCCDAACEWYWNHSAQMRSGVISVASRRRIDGSTSAWGSTSGRGWFMIFNANAGADEFCTVGSADLDWYIPA